MVPQKAMKQGRNVYGHNFYGWPIVSKWGGFNIMDKNILSSDEFTLSRDAVHNIKRCFLYVVITCNFIQG